MPATRSTFSRSTIPRSTSVPSVWRSTPTPRHTERPMSLNRGGSGRRLAYAGAGVRRAADIAPCGAQGRGGRPALRLSRDEESRPNEASGAASHRLASPRFRAPNAWEASLGARGDEQLAIGIAFFVDRRDDEDPWDSQIDEHRLGKLQARLEGFGHCVGTPRS